VLTVEPSKTFSFCAVYRNYLQNIKIVHWMEDQIGGRIEGLSVKSPIYLHGMANPFADLFCFLPLNCLRENVGIRSPQESV
jgi:hypothetical protein